MTRPFAPTCLVLLCSLAVGAPVAARAYTGQELAPQAKVTEGCAGNNHRSRA